MLVRRNKSVNEQTFGEGLRKSEQSNVQTDWWCEQ